MNKSMLVFEIANAKFGLNLDLVEEVVPATAYTRVPNAPPFFLGLTSVRGKIVGVIDAAKRYNIGPSLNSHYVVCYVRGSLTAIAVGHPVIAGDIPLRSFSDEETKGLVQESKVDSKFIKAGYEVLERQEDGNIKSTGVNFCEIDPDLFVSNEMASKIGEV